MPRFTTPLFCQGSRLKTVAYLALFSMSTLFQAPLALAEVGASSAEPAQQSAPATAEAPQVNGQVVDRILVTVNDEIILLSDLQKVIYEASQRQSTIDANGRLSGPLTENDAKMLMEQLIDQRIISLRAQELALTVSEDELNQEIEAFLKGQGITREQLIEALRQEGETEENYRTEFRRQLETQRFIGRVIRPLVTVTAAEVRNFYLQQSGNKADPNQKVRLRSLVLEMPPSLTDAERTKKQETIETIQKEIAQGSEFSSLVKLYSDASDVMRTNGELPPRSMGELPEEVREGVRQAKPGQVIGPVLIGSSVFFFEYMGSESSNMSDFEKQKATWENRLLEVKFQERLTEYVRAERAKLRIDYKNFTIQKS